MRAIKWIVLHCTATSQTASVESIQRYWKNMLGWKQPGYHRVIEASGKVRILADYDEVVNGVKGHNANSIHISYIGGVDKEMKPIDNRTPGQLLAMEELVREAKLMFPNAVICGHRDFPGVKKACPSFDVREWLGQIGMA